MHRALVRRRRSAEHDEEAENHERWLITYADMITLLLALFMMLYALSVLDLNKYQAFRESFNQGMGKGVHALPGPGDPPEGKPNTQSPGVPDGKPTPTPAPVAVANGKPVADRSKLVDLKVQLERAISSAGLRGRVEVALDKRGLVVFVTDGVLFDSGQAELRPDGQQILERLAPVLGGVGNDMIVQGHTDNVPITGGRFASNWELSTARATAVLRRLLATNRLDARQVSAAGYADTRPRFKNDSVDHKARNRRVEVVIEQKAA